MNQGKDVTDISIYRLKSMALSTENLVLCFSFGEFWEIYYHGEMFIYFEYHY